MLCHQKTLKMALHKSNLGETKTIFCEFSKSVEQFDHCSVCSLSWGVVEGLSLITKLSLQHSVVFFNSRIHSIQHHGPRNGNFFAGPT